MKEASRGNEIPTELFQILKDNAVNAALSMPPNLEIQQWPQDCKWSVLIPI